MNAPLKKNGEKNAKDLYPECVIKIGKNHINKLLNAQY